MAPAPVSSRVIAASVATAGAAASSWYKYSAQLHHLQLEAPKEGQEPDKNPIEVNLMNKIAAKPYLQAAIGADQRPRGVPPTLRILAVDLPELRELAFSGGSCRLVHDRVFPDGVAPAKRVDVPAGDAHSSKKTTLQVEQKAWVHSLVQCCLQHQPNSPLRNGGVDLLEASMATLNPNNVRTTRQLGAYQYDPGKYSRKMTQENDFVDGSHEQTKTNTTATTSPVVGDGNENERHLLQQKMPVQVHKSAMEKEELDAPWNQYAWMEELALRVHGRVHFGAPMEQASRWDRIASGINGNTYKATVPSSRPWWESVLPGVLKRDPAGLDGGGTATGKQNWASHKPHAVIVNGLAVQRVPTGLRQLQKSCREANVPLFVIHDPRDWGLNTHRDLHQALRDLRYIVKRNVISKAMQQQSGFESGRLVGRLERHAVELVTRASEDRRRRQQAMQEKRWDELNAAALEKKLIEHGVIQVIASSSDDDGASFDGRSYTPAMVELSKQCIASESERPH